MGNEGAGLSGELAAVAGVEAGIPMPGEVESLNVGAALAVCLFERVRQRRAPGQSRQPK
jgi:TrmH family RNA methyltransferase